MFGELQLDAGGLDRVGLPVDEHEESPVERHDTGRVGLLDVASLRTQPRRAQPGSRANVQIVFRAIHQPHKLGKSRHPIVSAVDGNSISDRPLQALFIDSYVKRTDMNIARTPSGSPQAGNYSRSRNDKSTRPLDTKSIRFQSLPSKCLF